MKVMKLALLGAAAVAAVSVSARADDLTALKAQIEALNSRISQLEAAPAVPAGYQLLTINEAPKINALGVELEKGELPTATTIGILPTADMPASTSVQWSGYVKAAIYWDNEDGVYDSLDASYDGDGVGPTPSYDEDVLSIKTSQRLDLKATTDTAVGEVGVFVRWESSSEGDDFSGGDIMRYYGWWKMTPEMQLLGGFKDSIGGVGAGMDSCTCNFVPTVGVLSGSGDNSQFELRYASGPIQAAIAVENHDWDDDSLLGSGEGEWGVAAELKWAGDSVSGEIAGWMKEGDSGAEDAWQVGAGVTFGMDMITLTAAAGLGSGHGADDDYWEASILASAALSESITLELGAGMTTPEGSDNDTVGVYGAAYWSPVSQLSIGVEAGWVDMEGADDDDFDAALVTVFQF